MEPSPIPPGIPQANTVLGEQLLEDVSPSETSCLSEETDAASMHRSARWERPMDLASLGTVQPHPWYQDLAAVRRSFIRQILGLNPFRTSYFALYRPLKDLQSRAILVAGTILAIAAGIPLPLIGVVLGKIINNFPPSEEDLKYRLIQLMGIAVVYFIVTWGWSVCWAIVGERVSRKTRENLVERAMGLDMTYFDTAAPNMSNILTEKTQTIQLGTSEKVGLFIASISYFIAAFAVGFTLNPRLTGVMFTTVIPSMAFIVICGTTAVSKFSRQASSYTEKAVAVAESAIRAVQVVQAFGVSDPLARDHLNFLQSSFRAGVKKSVVGAFMLGSGKNSGILILPWHSLTVRLNIVWCIAYSANALAFWYGNQLRHRDGEDAGQAGTIYAVVFLILDASFVVGQIGPFIQTFALAAAAGQSVFSVLDQPQPEIDVYSTEGMLAEPSHFKANVVFQDVSFVYPSRQTVRVLDEVSFQFQAGKVTGLVGPSGSGKSTVTSLLLRLYDPSDGKITLGRHDLKDFNVSSFRSHIALVTQHPTLFSGTILENIKHGLPKSQVFSEDEVLARCTAAAADAHCDFLESLPDGIHTKIGTGHHSLLSGGQKQRITLARALVGDPSLLLLDEFTSAMDATSEAVVLENLKRTSSSSKRTTIIIAHRLATVKDADQILVMKDGAVVEEGQHEKLIKSNGIYADLIRAQQFDKKQIPSIDSPANSSNQSSQKEGVTRNNALEPNGDTVRLLPSEKKQSNSAQLITRCLKLNQQETPFITLGLLSSIISGGIIIGEAIIFGNLVELLNDQSNSSKLDSRVALFCLMFFVLAIIALVSHTCSGSAFGLISEKLVVRVRDISLRTILAQDIAWFSRPGHSHHILMSRLSMDSGHLSGLSGVILGTFFSITTSVVGGIILAHIVAWKIAIVLLSAVPVMLVAGFLRLRILAKAEERHQTSYNAAAALASEACAAIQTIASLGRERDVLQMYREALQKPYEESLKFSIWGNVLLAFSLSVTYFVYALAYWW